MQRRDFARAIALGGVATLLAPRIFAQATAPAEQGSGSAAAPVQGNTSNLFDMNQEAAQTVRRPPRPGASPSMTPEERDSLEHGIRCQCGCTLDVYTCRTTDFSCQVSPAMHRDIISLVEGGYSAQEILDAFVQTYGERALMSPKRQGFNWAGYLVPFGALAVGSAALAFVLRRMQRRTAIIAAGKAGAPSSQTASGTDDEMTRLRDAIRKDE